MTFTFEEINEIGNVAKQCAVNVGLKERTLKNMHCKNILRSVGRIQEEDLINIVQHTEFDALNKPSFVRQAGILIPSSQMNVRLKSDVLRKIENLID